MPDKERRTKVRIDSLNLLSYLVIDRKGQVVTQGVGRTLNVSAGGILLETHTSLHTDHTVSVFLALEDDLVDVSGRIVHSSLGDEGKYNTGIAFDDLDETAIEIIEQFISAFKERNST